MNICLNKMHTCSTVHTDSFTIWKFSLKQIYSMRLPKRTWFVFNEPCETATLTVSDAKIHNERNEILNRT